MPTPHFNLRSIRTISTYFAVLCLLSATVFGQTEENSPPPPPSTSQISTGPPPVEQALVPEGVLAAQLAEALKLGSTPDEAQAESLLSNLGIEPENGWISDYPVTPAVIGDIERGVTMAVEQGKIALGKDQALKVVGDVKAKLGLAVKPGLKAPVGATAKPDTTTIYRYTDKKGLVHYTNLYDSVPPEYQDTVKIIRKSVPQAPVGETGAIESETPGPGYAANQTPEVINNYYYEEGPPAVTYYVPPEPYYYLYSWVPYPFWSAGFYFPGFFILRDFHRHVFFNRHPYFVSHHFGNGGHRWPFSAGPGAKNQAARPMPALHGFTSPVAQSSARTIVMLNQQRFNSVNPTIAPRMNPLNRQPPALGWTERMRHNPAVLNGQARLPQGNFRLVPYNGGRIFNPPTFRPRYFAPSPPRAYFSPFYSQGRHFGVPHAFGGRSFGGFGGGSGGTFGGFHPGGSFAGHGGSFSGGLRGGHR